MRNVIKANVVISRALPVLYGFLNVDRKNRTEAL